MPSPTGWTRMSMTNANNAWPIPLWWRTMRAPDSGTSSRRGFRGQVMQSLDNLGKQQKAAWVSGFYGSGKSHLVKVLRYLWTDYPLPGNASARSLATLPGEVSDLLKELSTQGKRGAGLHSAGGTLKAGTGN